MTTYTTYFGDIEYDVVIDGGDVYVDNVYTDLGMDISDLFFVPRDKPFKSDGTPNYVSLEQRMCEFAYEKFLDEWGSEKAFDDSNYADDKHDLQSCEVG